MNQDSLNQFLDVGQLIVRIETETKRKSARLTIGIPQVLAEKLITQIAGGEDNIQGMMLSWYDKGIN